MSEAGLGKVWEDFIIPKHTGTGGSPHMGYNIARTIPHSHHNLPCRRRPRAAPAMFLYHILGYDFLLYSCRQIINYNSYSAPLQFFVPVHSQNKPRMPEYMNYMRCKFFKFCNFEKLHEKH